MPKKFFVTTSIPYANAPLHIGHALEFVQADVLTRAARSGGQEAFLLTGTDEHGKKIQEAAEKAGKTPQEFVDGIAENVKAVLAALNVRYDGFIRTSSSEHKTVAQGVWKKLAEKGDIELRTYRGKYCTGCEAFLRDIEIRDGKCVIHEKAVQEVEEKNYFFKFSRYAADVEKKIREDELVVLPEHRKHEVLNLFSEEGVADVSVSRPKESVGWGIPVSGDESQTMYVWVDALSNYLSGIGYNPETGTFREQCWPPDVQVIGKDIARFHTMIWPAMLLSLGLALPKKILIHGHISVEGRKMSKSLGNTIDPIELAQKYGADAVRYYLLREIPSDGDGDVSFERFRERYVADLQNGLGNLVSRVSTLGEKYSDASKNIVVKDNRSMKGEGLERFQLHHVLADVWKLVAESNKLVEDTKLWELAGGNPQQARDVFATIAQNLYQTAHTIQPFLPETSEKIFAALGIAEKGGTVVFKKPSAPLFPPLS